MNSVKERLVNGIVKENPTFVLMLGMCPTLAVTTSAINEIGRAACRERVLVTRVDLGGSRIIKKKKKQ